MSESQYVALGACVLTVEEKPPLLAADGGGGHCEGWWVWLSVSRLVNAAGAEAILQVRAAYLSDDGRGEEFHQHRPRGHAVGRNRLRPAA